MADHTANAPPRSSVFVGMSIRQRLWTTAQWLKRLVIECLRVSFGHQKRFYVLSPPLLCRQVIYDRLNKSFINIRIRDSIDRSVISQVFESNDYGFEKLARHVELQTLYERFVTENGLPLIVDCGAHAGIASRFFFETYPRARIIAIEPDRENIELARENNKQGDVTFLHAAVGNSDGRGSIVDAKAESWAYRINSNPNGETDIISINSVLAENRGAPARPFIVKIDIEGFEQYLFENNTEWIDEFPVLIIELHDWMLPKSANSSNVLKELSKRNRDFIYFGENCFSIANTI